MPHQPAIEVPRMMASDTRRESRPARLAGHCAAVAGRNCGPGCCEVAMGLPFGEVAGQGDGSFGPGFICIDSGCGFVN